MFLHFLERLKTHKGLPGDKGKNNHSLTETIVGSGMYAGHHLNRPESYPGLGGQRARSGTQWSWTMDSEHCQTPPTENGGES